MRKRENFLGVDILRFSAALMVLVYHLGFKSWSLGDYALNSKLGVAPAFWAWSPFTWFGWVGVQVFFVISGFVVAFSSEAASPMKFLRSRLMRLAPAMWIAAAMALAVALYWQLFPVPVAFYLFFKSIVFAPFGPWIAGQIWTLPIELAFYAIMFLLLCLDQFRRVDRVVLALALMSAAYWTAVETGFYTEQAGRLTQLLLLQHGCYFALGAAMWICTRRGPTPFNLALIALSVAPAWFQIKATLLAEAPGYGLDSRPLVPFAVWLALMALMGLSIYFNGALNRLLAPAADGIRLAGRITYPLYLVHFHVGGLVMVLAHLWGIPPLVSIGLATLASTAVAALVAEHLERPVARWLGEGVQRAISLMSTRLGSQTFLLKETREFTAAAR